LDTADPDTDGLSNYFEFLHGTSAVTANAMYPATQSITGDEWVLEYTINQMALAAGLVLEKSTDLQNWTPVSAGTVLSPADPIGTVRVHLDITGARATFVRLRY